MAKRAVKTAGAALAATRRPVVVDGLENVVAGLGTDRDKASYTHYGLPKTLDRQSLENLYRGSWLAKRIINSVADDMTRAWRTPQFDDETGGTQFAIESIEKRLGVKAKINEAIRWGRLYGGALVIIGTNDGPLDTPLDVDRLGRDCLRYLHVVDRWRVSHDGRIDMDLGSPNFGLPIEYILAESSVRVHHSRVLRFNGQKLPYFAWRANAMWDDSELQHVLDSVLDCDATRRGIATMVFEANVDVIKSPAITDLLSSKSGEAKVIKRFQVAAMMKSFNRTLVLDGEESYEKKSNSFANLHDILGKFMVDVCGAADIPMTRLFGLSAGGLNATGDNEIRNYYDMIAAKQEADLRPQLERLDQVLVRSALGNYPEEYAFEFESLWQQSDSEVAATQYARAQRDQIYLNAGVVGPETVARDLKETHTYQNLTETEIAAAKNGDYKPEPDGDEGGAPARRPKTTKQAARP